MDLKSLRARAPGIVGQDQCPGSSTKSMEIDSETIAASTIKVYLRLKPMDTKKVKSTKEYEVYQISSPTTLLTKFPHSEENKTCRKDSSQMDISRSEYKFTKIFDPQTAQKHIFDQIVHKQLTEFLDGKNGCIITCGSTNSGKTHTLHGSSSDPGLVPRSLEFLFTSIKASSTLFYKPENNCEVKILTTKEISNEIDMKKRFLASIKDRSKHISAYQTLQQRLIDESPKSSSEDIKASSSKDIQYWVFVSLAEIYNESIYDLLSRNYQERKSLTVLPDIQGSHYIKGLTKVLVNSSIDAFQILMAGLSRRQVAGTELNTSSSRSHCIFTITLLMSDEAVKQKQVKMRKFSFCDLAGSERIGEIENRNRADESKHINTSFYVLSKCLKSVHDNQIQQKNHVVPFRGSKFTYLFERELSGKESLSLIVTIDRSPIFYKTTRHILNCTTIAKRILQQEKQPQHAKLQTRFSLVVSQSAATNTNWENTEVLHTIEQSPDDLAEVLFERDNYERLLIENERLKRENASLKAFNIRRDNENTHSNELKKQYEDLKALNENLKSLLDEAKQEFIQSTDDKLQQEEKISRLEEQSVIMMEKYADLQDELETGNILFEERSKLLNTLEERVALEKQLREESSEKLKTLEQKIQENNILVERFNDEKRRLQEHVDKLLDDNQSLSKSLQEVQTQDELSTTILTSLKQEHNDAKNRLEDLEQLVQEKDHNIENLNVEKENLQKRLDEALRNEEDYDEALKSHKNQIKEIEKKACIQGKENRKKIAEFISFQQKQIAALDESKKMIELLMTEFPHPDRTIQVEKLMKKINKLMEVKFLMEASSSGDDGLRRSPRNQGGTSHDNV